ncbi:MAG TPA: lycopene cyclase family protein, partial [Flavobacterium sp.]|nr:lycopene cyclase family protein [Flavobacterium sp.]
MFKLLKELMRYDYIFSGMGLSTLMILHKMIRKGVCRGKTVLIIEADVKNQNDKTWCFWEKGNGAWDFLLKKSWKEAFFISDEVKVNCLEDGYEYKMLESKVFCNFVLQEIKEYDGIHIVHDIVNGFEERGEFVLVSGDENQYETRY